MAYERQTFIDRVVDASGNVLVEGTKLRAAHLQHIENGIIANEWTEEKQADVVNAVIAALPVYNGEVAE